MVARRLMAPRRYAGMQAIADSVAFFGSRDAVVAVRRPRPRRWRAQHLVVYTSANGGHGWSGHLAPVAADLRADQLGWDGTIAFSAPRATDWLFFAGLTLYATTDAGP
jgi:hypothetical protein